MKAHAFEYLRARSLDDALAALAARPGDARVLAGGQSLVPVMNMRLAAPAALVDVNGLAELRGVEVRGGYLRIGALTRHFELLESRVVAEHAPLVALAVPYVGHEAIPEPRDARRERRARGPGRRAARLRPRARRAHRRRVDPGPAHHPRRELLPRALHDGPRAGRAPRRGGAPRGRRGREVRLPRVRAARRGLRDGGARGRGALARRRPERRPAGVLRGGRAAGAGARGGGRRRGAGAHPRRDLRRRSARSTRTSSRSPTCTARPR